MKIRLLIVDEKAFVRDALKRSVRRFLKDVEIFDATNGHRAIAALRANKINVIISEWDLSEMTGLELLQWVRGEEKFAKTPFIVTSDGGDRNLVMSAINAGANDFMAKPFSPDEVQKKVVKQLARIGYRAKGPAQAAQNTGFGSVDVLTGGGGSAPAKPKPQKPREIRSASGFGKPAAKSPTSKAAAKSAHFDGVAHVHFKHSTARCVISDLSLTGISATMVRPEAKHLPSLFDTASADIENGAGEPIGKLNVYVNALHSSDPRPDASGLKISFRFAENEPEQFEMLSKAIARGH